MRARNGFHSFEVFASVLDGLFRGHELIDVVGEVEHDFAEEHVLESCRGFLRLVLSMVAVEGFDEVGECGVEIFVFGMKLAGLHVETCLEEGWSVYGCGTCSSAG